MERHATTVYTDGACSGNPGPGGWAWAVPGGRWASGAARHTTNQRMEIQAVLDAVTALAGPLDVVSDSTYVVNCFRDRWWEGWLRKGWVNSQKKPVANRDLWEPLIEAYRDDPGRLRFTWVKGHSGDPMNDLVDRLAVAAAAAQEDRAGSTPPADPGPPDPVGRGRPGAAPAPDSATPGRPPGGEPAGDGVPAGHKVVVTGVKPPALGGYNDPPAARAVKAKLVEILGATATLHPDLVVLSGLGLGVEQLAAEAALEAGVPFVAVLPYPDPDAVWAGPARQHFASLLVAAQGVATLQRQAPDSRRTAGAALARRDAWLARHADEAIVVWDDDDPGVGRAVRSLQDHLGEEQVWVLPVPTADRA